MKKVTIKEMQSISTKKPINENEMQETIGGKIKFLHAIVHGDHVHVFYERCFLGICGKVKSKRVDIK